MNGYNVGEVCGRNGCKGIIQEHELVGCSCHINPPCSACTTPKEYCPECGYESKNDRFLNDYVINEDPKTLVVKSYELRTLDGSKIDWHTKSHTYSSMLCEGVYPEGTIKEQVEEKVRGSFGGRFEYFGNGKFCYVAYTD